MRDGVIADFEATEKMLRYFIEKVISRRWFVKPRMVIGVPTCITEVEKRAVRDSAEQAGARDVYLIQESMAAAIGANIPILEPAGHMICDIGGGTTEISVISLGGMVVTNAIRVGGDEFDEAIIKHVRNVHNLIIGESTAENVKITIGNASPDKKIEKIEIKGTDAITGLPAQAGDGLRGGARSAAGADEHGHRRDQEDPGPDAARAGRGHRGARAS